MLGLGLGLAFLTGFSFGAYAFVVWSGICALAVARKSLSLAAAAVILVVAGLGAWHAGNARADTHLLVPSGGFEGMIEIGDGPFLTRSGQRFTARMEQNAGPRLCVYASSEPQVFAADRVFVTGRITQLSDLSDIGEAAARTRNCDAQLRVGSMQVVERGSGFRADLARFRVRLSGFLMQAAPGDVGALMSGLATGEDGGLSDDANDAFVSSGTTHITAISGANFAMIALLLGAMASGSMKRSVGFVLAATAVIWLYALMVGLQPSSLRAALLATAVLAGKWIGRRPDLLTLTLLLAALQVAIRPHDFGTLAFQLSFSATLALIVVFDGSERGGERSTVLTLVLSVIAAQLATVPILAWQLGTVSGIGTIANLVVVPLAGFAFPIALAGAAFGQVVPALGELVLLPARAICQGILLCVEWMDRLLPGTLQLGEPTWTALGMLALACWWCIFWMSGDLRRATRHGFEIARSW